MGVPGSKPKRDTNKKKCEKRSNSPFSSQSPPKKKKKKKGVPTMLYAIGLSSSLSETQLVLISGLTTLSLTRVGGIVVIPLIRNINLRTIIKG